MNPMSAGRHWIGEKMGGATIFFGQFHIFLKSPMLKTPISFLRKLVSFRKCVTNKPNRLKTLLKVFWQFKTLFEVFCETKHFEVYLSVGLFTQNTLCFAISLTIVITSLPCIPYWYENNSQYER